MCAGLTKNRVHPESTDQSHSGVSHVYFLWIISIKCDYTFLSRKSVETWTPIIYCVGVALGLHSKLSSWGKQKSVVKLLYLYIYIYIYIHHISGESTPPKGDPPMKPSAGVVYASSRLSRGWRPETGFSWWLMFTRSMMENCGFYGI